jgi:hypothetical protein
LVPVDPAIVQPAFVFRPVPMPLNTSLATKRVEKLEAWHDGFDATRDGDRISRTRP